MLINVRNAIIRTVIRTKFHVIRTVLRNSDKFNNVLIMKKRDQKRDLLCVLAQEAQPISLSELLEKLDNKCNERTLRRWLNELIDEKVVVKEGTTKLSKYSIKNKINDRLLPSPQDKTAENITPSQKIISNCFGSESLDAIEKISRPKNERPEVSYNIEWLESYEPNKSFYLPQDLRVQLHQAGHRARKQDPAGTYAHQIYNRLLIDISYNSSRLEGNTYSLLDTERLLMHGDSAEGKLDEDKIMILNHKEAIRFLVDNAERLDIDVNVILTLHYLLSDGLVDPKYAGKVRDCPVVVKGSNYLPFFDKRRLEAQLEEIAKKSKAIEDPFEQSIFLLIHISYLQAFVDVNKRTSRLCSNVPLIKGNLVPLAFKDVEIRDYVSALFSIYELQDPRPLADLYVYSYMRTCSSYDVTVKALGFDEVRVRYRQIRRGVIRHIVLQKMTGKDLLNHIDNEIKKVPVSDQEELRNDILEDLEHLDQSRVVGLGITHSELDDWLIKKSSESS